MSVRDELANVLADSLNKQFKDMKVAYFLDGSDTTPTDIKEFISTEIEWIPLNSVNVEKNKEETVINFLETLEDDDDVQNVFSNVNFGNN